MLTNCIFSKSRHGLWMWWMRLCLYRRLELMARLSFRSISKGRSSKWGSSLQGRSVSFIQGGGLVDLRGLCTWFGGVVENSTGGVASLPRKWNRRRKFSDYFFILFSFSLSPILSLTRRCDLIECTWFIDWIINGRYCKKGECYFLQSTNYI